MMILCTSAQSQHHLTHIFTSLKKITSTSSLFKLLQATDRKKRNKESLKIQDKTFCFLGKTNFAFFSSKKTSFVFSSSVENNFLLRDKTECFLKRERSRACFEGKTELSYFRTENTGCFSNLKENRSCFSWGRKQDCFLLAAFQFLYSKMRKPTCFQ